MMLWVVPLTRPTTAAIVMMTFLTTMKAFFQPVVWFQKTHVWIIAGNASPNADRHRAPNKEMNSSIFGMATASKTKPRNKNRIEIVFVIESAAHMLQRPAKFASRIPRSLCISGIVWLNTRSTWCRSRHSRPVRGWWKWWMQASLALPLLFCGLQRWISWSFRNVHVWRSHMSFRGRFKVMEPRISDPNLR